MIIGIRTLYIISQIIQGKPTVIDSTPTPIHIIVGKSVPTGQIETVPGLIAFVSGINHRTPPFQLALDKFVPCLVTTGITVSGISHTSFGKSIIPLKILRYIFCNGSGTIYTIIHIDQNTAMIEQPSHFVIIVGSRQNSIPIIIGLIVEIDRQKTDPRSCV